MPIISGRRALVAWAHGYLHSPGRRGCRVPGPGAWKLQSSFRSTGLLSGKGHHSQSRGPATHQVLCHSSQACAQRRHGHAHTTLSSGCRVMDTHLCSSPPEGPCGPAQSRSHSLCLVRLRLGALASLRSTQRRAAWPTLAASPAAAAHTGGLPCSCGPPGLAGAWRTARSTAHGGPWGMALRKRAHCCSHTNVKF